MHINQKIALFSKRDLYMQRQLKLFNLKLDVNEIKQYNPIWPLNHLQVNNSNNLFEQETSENFKVEDNLDKII